MNFQDIQDLDRAATYAREVFPDLAAAPFYIPKQGRQYWTLMTETEVVRIARGQMSPSAHAAASLLLAFGDASYMPKLRVFDADRGIMRISRMPGLALNECPHLGPRHEEQIGAELGCALADLHARHPQSATLVGQENRAIDLISDAIRLNTDFAKNQKERTGGEKILYTYFEACVRDTEEDRLVTSHADLHEGNIIYRPAKDHTTPAKVSVVDFDAMSLASPSLDLVVIAGSSVKIALAAFEAYNLTARVPCDKSAFDAGVLAAQWQKKMACRRWNALMEQNIP